MDKPFPKVALINESADTGNLQRAHVTKLFYYFSTHHRNGIACGIGIINSMAPEDHCSRRMSLKALVVYCVAFIVVAVDYHASPVNGLVCHCMVGFDDLRDTEPCDNVTNTRMCAPGGVCAVWLAGGQVLQQCIYHQFSIQTCSNLNTLLCCNVDLCNGVDNFTEFQASQTNNIGSSTNIAVSSSSNTGTSSSSTSMINLGATPSAVEPTHTTTTMPNSPASSTEKSTGSDSSPPVHAIVLSVVLPLMIIAVFAIAMVIFLMYIRLYIKHNREKSSSESEFSQIYK